MSLYFFFYVCFLLTAVNCHELPIEALPASFLHVLVLKTAALLALLGIAFEAPVIIWVLPVVLIVVLTLQQLK